jgi:hypothetical protein
MHLRAIADIRGPLTGVVELIALRAIRFDGSYTQNEPFARERLPPMTYKIPLPCKRTGEGCQTLNQIQKLKLFQYAFNQH